MANKSIAADEKTHRSMVDIAYDVLAKEKKPLSFRDIMKKVNEIKKLGKQEYEEQIARLYTNINLDGRFLSVGESQWGLKDWYPVDEQAEEIAAPAKRKKKKRKQEKQKKEIEKEPIVEEDEFEELNEDDYEDFDDDEDSGHDDDDKDDN